MAEQETEVRDEPAQVTYQAPSEPAMPDDTRKGTVITAAGVVVIVVITAALSVLIANIRRADPSPLDFAGARSIRTFRFTITTTATGEGQPFEIVMNGEVDVEQGLVSIEHTYPGPQPLKIRSISTSQDLIFELPAELRSGFNVKEPWIRAPLTPEAIAAFRQGGGIMGPPDDPRAFFEGLSTHATAIIPEGAEVVRGVATTRYRLTLDVESFMLSLPGTNDDDVTAVLKELESDTMPGLVWIGDDGLPYRQSFDIAVEGTTFKTVLEFFDFNERLDIELPPDADIADAPAGLFGAEEASCSVSQTGSTDGQTQPSPSVSCSPSP